MLAFELNDDVVRLVPPGPSDVDEITRMCQSDDIQEWTTVPSPYSRDDAESFVADYVLNGWATGRTLNWSVRTGGALRGMVGLGIQPVASAEIGYWLAPEARGHGLMHRAAALVVEHAFDPAGLDLDRLEWRAYRGNWPSWRTAWRLGFRFEGSVRGEGIQRGLRRDSWLATLLRDDPREPVLPWPGIAQLALPTPPER